MSSSISSIPPASSLFQKWIPFLTPALKGNSCEISSEDCNSRAKTVALTIFATMAIPFCFISFTIAASVLPVSLVLSPFLWTGLWTFDDNLTRKAATIRAQNEYLTLPIPSQSATDLLKAHPEVLRELLKKAKEKGIGDIVANKENENGEALLDDKLPEFSIFQLLVDNGAKLIRKKNSPFDALIKGNWDSNYIDYIRKQKIQISTLDLSPDKQVELWKNIGSKEAASFLKEQLFDINIRNEKGDTALCLLIRIAKLDVEDYGPQPYVLNKVRILLDHGANPDLPIRTMSGGISTIRKINTHPEIRDFFSQVDKDGHTKKSIWD